MEKVLLIAVFICGLHSSQIRATKCSTSFFPIAHEDCCNLSYDDKFQRICYLERLQNEKNGTSNIKKAQKADINVALCLAECALKKKHFLNDSDAIDLGNIREYLTQNFGYDPNYVDVLTKGYEKCAENAKIEAKHLKLQFEKSEYPPLTCGAFPLIVDMCAYSYLFEHCPHKRWHPAKKCNAAKAMARKCPPFGIDYN